MMRRLFLLLLTVLALAVGASACGGDDDDDAAEQPPATEESTTHENGGGGHLTLTADPGGDLSFDQTELTAAAGDVTIELVNESTVPHNVEVEGSGVEEVSDTITESTTELAITLEPGEYVFYCAVPGHREAGMEGTLAVE